ncbi:PTS system mannose/fructose/sorbose family transporter subunit IID [Enterococcus avium]|uniref:PTS system mannose/fructose/sorbose family transporter subunit IID n=1 Tax=Enterococcus avium TaxID=33945 RepID=UPI003703F81E
MNVQEILDSIFKGIVPLLVTLGCFKLLDKKVGVIKIIFGMVVLGIYCHYLESHSRKLQLLGCSFLARRER